MSKKTVEKQNKTIKDLQRLLELGGSDADLFLLDKIIELQDVTTIEGLSASDIFDKIAQVKHEISVEAPTVNQGAINVAPELRINPQDIQAMALIGRQQRPIKGEDYFTKEDIEMIVIESALSVESQMPPIIAQYVKDEFANIDIPVLDTAEEIRNKLSSLQGDQRLDAKYIKNLPRPILQGGGGKSQLRFLADVDIAGVTDGQALIYRASDGRWVAGAAGGAATWGSITGTVTDQTDLVTYVTGLPISTFTNDSNYFDTAGTGLTSSSSTVNLDIPGLTNMAAAVDGADTIALYDTSATAHVEATMSQLLTYMQANITSSATLQDVTDNGNTTTNKIAITLTTSQFELAYDGTNGVDFTVDASNNFTMSLQSGGGYFAVGNSQVLASATHGIAIGNQTTLNGANNSIVMGRQASVTANDAFVAGYLSVAQSARTVVIGALSEASGSSAGDSVTIGYNSTSTQRYAITLGAGLTNSLSHTFQIGFSGNQSFFVNRYANVMLNALVTPISGTHYDANATNTLTIHAGTAPAGQITDAAQIYAESDGSLVIDRLLKRYDGTGTTPTLASSTLAVFQNNAASADDAYISIIGGLTGDAGINFGTSADENAGQIRYETNTNPDRFSIYVEGGTINVRHSNTQHIFYKNGATAVQIYDFFTSTAMAGASGGAPLMWMNTSYNVSRPQYARYDDNNTGMALPGAGVVQWTSDASEILKGNNSGQISVNGSGVTQNFQFQVTTTDDAVVDTDTIDVSGMTAVLHRNSLTNNAGVGLGFVASTSNTVLGAAIVHERTDANSKGRLRFAVKTDTTQTDLEDAFAIEDNGNTSFFGRLLNAKGADVASATNITLGNDGNYFDITGTTTINTIITTGWTAGSVAMLRFDASVTVTHAGAGTGAQIYLEGSANFAATNGDLLTLVYDGGIWREQSRMVL